jgi:hypothetical protein
VPPLPNCMYWIGSAKPSGGYINRKDKFENDCPHYAIKYSRED